jgi:hypothetical protein
MKGISIMSKSKLQFKRNITNKLSVKGILSEDGTFISYTDENDIEQDVKISVLLKAFINQPIEFSVSLKSDEDLELIISERTDE